MEIEPITETTGHQEKPKRGRRGPPRSGVPWCKSVSIPGPLVAAVTELVKEYRKTKAAVGNRNE